MKKTQIAIVCLLAVAGMIMTGCKKEENGKVSLTATIASGVNDGKVYINSSNYPAWESGDQVWVNGQTLPLSDIRGTKAKIEGVNESTTGYYWAVFPADAAPEGETSIGTTLDFTIPHEQVYASDGTDQKVNAPMVAYSTSKKLVFKNVCSLIKVHVTNTTSSAFEVKRIVVTSSTYITGRATSQVSDVTENGVVTDHTVQAPAITTGYYDAVLQLNGHSNATIANNGSADFYVIVAPMQGSADVTVSLYTTTGKHMITSFSGVRLLQSQFAPVTMSVSTLDDNPFIDGHFTINSSGKQVRFSKGNLQFWNNWRNHYTTEERHFRFATHQYDYVGNGNDYGNVSSCNNIIEYHHSAQTDKYYTGQYKWMDLFGWGTGGNPIDFSTNQSTFIDWNGNDDISEEWYTLTKNEWDYILNRRLPESSPRFLKATVNGVKGLVLFPDVFTDNATISQPTTINNKSNNFTATITLADWNLLEKEGVVFLPACGYRSGRDSFTNIQTFGYYWTRDNYDNTTAYQLRFFHNNSASNISTEARLTKQYGCSVRLVQDVQ